MDAIPCVEKEIPDCDTKLKYKVVKIIRLAPVQLESQQTAIVFYHPIHQGRSALPWKPWIFGLEDSHLYLATHSGILSSI